MKLTIQAHCSDSFYMTVEKDDGTEVEYNGYVPKFLGDHGGDDVCLTIDNATGQVVGWIPLTEEQLNETLNAE